MKRALKVLAILSTVAMFLVMIAGALVTKTESGLGCGNDWPLCNGRWVPEYTIKSLIEYSHRFITGIAGLLVVAFSVMSWVAFRGNKEVRAISIMGLFFIVLESWLGAAAVISPQSAPVLALHFGFSLLAYSGVFLLTLITLKGSRHNQVVTTPVSPGFRNFVWGVAIFAYGVIYLGAYVRHTNSNLVCPDWPLCQGELIPEMTGNVPIHFGHRLAAAVLFFLVLGMMVHAVRRYKRTRRDLYWGSIIAFVLVTAQVLSGGLVVLYRLHLYVTLTHSAIITILFGVLCYLCLQTLKSPSPQTTGGTEPERTQTDKRLAPLA